MQVFSIVKKPQFEFPVMDGVFLTAWVCQCVASVKAEMFHRTGNEPRGRSSLPQPPPPIFIMPFTPLRDAEKERRGK